MFDIIKTKTGITMIALLITVVILSIVIGVSLTIGISGIDEAREDVKVSELKMVKNAVLQQYYKYKISEDINYLVGEEVASYILEDLESEMDTYFLYPQGNGPEYPYYLLDENALKEIGINKSEDDYIVNYITGEVINYTTPLTTTRMRLYSENLEILEENNGGVETWE